MESTFKNQQLSCAPTANLQSQETVPTLPFVVTLKKISGINLRKEVEDSCSKTLTSLQKEKDTHAHGLVEFTWLERLLSHKSCWRMTSLLYRILWTLNKEPSLQREKTYTLKTDFKKLCECACVCVCAHVYVGASRVQKKT